MGPSDRLRPQRKTNWAHEAVLDASIKSRAVRSAAAFVVWFLVLFNIALISLEVASIPIRGMLASALLAILALVAPTLFLRALARHSWILLLAGVLAFIGTFVSVANSVPPAIIGRMILEVHIQSAVTLLLAAMLVQLAGPKAAVSAFCAAIAVTALFAVIQFADIDFGWRVREALGDLQGQNLSEDGSFINRRPMGASYSPIHLSTQACLAFAAYASWQLRKRESSDDTVAINTAILLGLAAMVSLSFLSETRSPILGAVIFLGVYMVSRGRAITRFLVFVIAVCAIAAAPLVLDLMDGSESRVFRIGDNSSTGRLPLVKFGLKLLADNPLGYGFGFESTKFWTLYWQEIYTLPSAGVIREAELHNYLLNMALTYGFGLLLVLPLVIQLLWNGRASLIAFLPYTVHILFHNTGPFWNDTLFWFVVGAISATNYVAPNEQDGRRTNTWRRPRALRPRTL